MKKLLLGVVVLLAIVAVSLGTYWLTVRYHTTGNAQAVEQKDEYPIPVLTYATSTTGTISGLQSSVIRGDGLKIECAVVGDSVNMVPPAKGCEVVVSDADFNGRVALQNIEDFEIWKTANSDANGAYSKAVRSDNYVYITANYADIQRPIEDVFVSEISNGVLSSPRKIFSCEEYADCYSLYSEPSYEPKYLTKEIVGRYMLIYQHILEKDTMQKNLIATVELNGWTSGVECVGEPCSNGQNWITKADWRNLTILRFERFVTPNEPWGYGLKEAKYLILELKKQ